MQLVEARQEKRLAQSLEYWQQKYQSKAKNTILVRLLGIRSQIHSLFSTANKFLFECGKYCCKLEREARDAINNQDESLKVFIQYISISINEIFISNQESDILDFVLPEEQYQYCQNKQISQLDEQIRMKNHYNQPCSLSFYQQNRDIQSQIPFFQKINSQIQTKPLIKQIQMNCQNVQNQSFTQMICNQKRYLSI